MAKLGKTVASIITFAMMLFSILGVSFCLLLSPPPTIIFSNLFSTERGTGMSHEEVVDVAQKVREYCVGESEVDLPWGAYDTPTTLSSNARVHLNDVRAVFHWSMLFTAFNVGGSILSLIIHLLCRCRRRLGTIYISAALTAIVLALVVAGCAIFNFDGAFTVLHSLFFVGDSWLFPGDCLLICALPEPFWIAMGASWIVFILFFGALTWILGSALRRNKRS